MRYAIIIAVLCLLATGAVFGQGTPWTIYGEVRNSDMTIPPADCLHFWAYYIPDSDTIRYPENSGPGEGTNYSEGSGVWLVETSSLSPPPEDGEVIYIAFMNICNDETALITVTVDFDSAGWNAGMVTLTFMGIEETAFPERRSLQVFPNPFNATCNFKIQNSEFRIQNLEIYDISGKLVRSLPVTSTETNSIIWDGRDRTGKELPAGVYLVRVGNNNYVRALMIK